MELEGTSPDKITRYYSIASTRSAMNDYLSSRALLLDSSGNKVVFPSLFRGNLGAVSMEIMYTMDSIDANFGVFLP